MKVKQAIELAKKEANLKSYFLSSCFCSIEDLNEPEEWTIHFYNASTGKVLSVIVNDGVINEGDSDPTGPMSELKMDDFNIDFDRAHKGIDAKDASKILVTLHMKDKLVWTFNLIAKDLSCKSIDIDANTGDKISEKTTSLLG